MELSKLREPFKEDEIEWRIGRCGKKANGQIWATCLAYVQVRAVMERLDEVCGPDRWSVGYRHIAGTQGVLCVLSIKTGEAWIAKEDGAEQTDIESFKGGLSSALKRAGVVWGIGRYLYALEEGWATIVDQGTEGALYGKTKENVSFHWLPPKLPAWALPKAVASPTGSPQPSTERAIRLDNQEAKLGGQTKSGLIEPKIIPPPKGSTKPLPIKIGKSMPKESGDVQGDPPSWITEQVPFDQLS